MGVFWLGVGPQFRIRSTIYALNKETPISNKEIVDIVKQAVLYVPLSFNSQSARLVVLLKAEHKKFWDATLELLKAMIPAEQVAGAERRVNRFKAVYKTISLVYLLHFLDHLNFPRFHASFSPHMPPQHKRAKHQTLGLTNVFQEYIQPVLYATVTTLLSTVHRGIGWRVDEPINNKGCPTYID